MKVFQILNGIAYWETPYKSVDETVGKFHSSIKFVETSDEVEVNWLYDEKTGKFTKPKEEIID